MTDETAIEEGPEGVVAVVPSDVRVAVEPPDVADAGLTAGDAEYLRGMAEAKRRGAENANNLWAAQQRAEAAGLDALAAALCSITARDLPPMHDGRGGEVAPAPDPDMPWHVRELAETVAAAPSALAADASLARLKLARDADALTLAVEAVDGETDGDPSPVEQMLTHQLAAAHGLAMRLVAAANSDLHRHVTSRAMGSAPTAQIEAVRSASTAARLMDASARLALTLDRLRNGAQQTIRIERMTVKNGGQAVVANAVDPGGAVRSQRPRRGRAGK